MSKEMNNVINFCLETQAVAELPAKEIRMILRAADDVVLLGDRRVLAKVLKGSKDRKIMEMQLDKSPAYGYYNELTLEEIVAKINWLIKNFYLEIQYEYGMPLLAYTDQGWEIEMDTFSTELLEKLSISMKQCNYNCVSDLKNRDRTLLLLLLDKIKDSGEKRFIPLLETWEKNDSQMTSEIRKVMLELQGNATNIVSFADFRRKKEQR